MDSQKELDEKDTHFSHYQTFKNVVCTYTILYTLLRFQVFPVDGI